MTDRPGVPSDLQRYAGVGMHFAATIGVFAGFGFWVDAKWGTQPWFLLVGVFSGFGLGLVSMVSKLGHRSAASHTPRTQEAPDTGSDRSEEDQT